MRPSSTIGLAGPPVYVALAESAEVDVAAALTRLGGVARRTDLEREGATREQLQAAVRRGEILLVRAGGYALPGAKPDLVTALRYSATLTCVSALRVHGFALLTPPAATHLSSPGDSGGRGGRGCVWHRDTRGPRIADVLPAAALALRCVAPADGLAITDQVLRRGWELSDLACRLPLRFLPSARWVLEHADVRSESVLESALRCALIRGGITDVEPQVEIDGVGRVDFLIGGWLVVEADGWHDHSSKPAFTHDRRRIVAAMQNGRLTMRFTWAEVVYTPEAVVAAVRDVLNRGQSGRFSTMITESLTGLTP